MTCVCLPRNTHIQILLILTYKNNVWCHILCSVVLFSFVFVFDHRIYPNIYTIEIFIILIRYKNVHKLFNDKLSRVVPQAPHPIRKKEQMCIYVMVIKHMLCCA